MNSRELTFIIVSLLLATIFGGFLGQLIGEYLPDGAVKTLFQQNLEIGIGKRGVLVNDKEIQEPVNINLYSISIAFGLLIKINFVSVMMVILVIIYFKWWYI